MERAILRKIFPKSLSTHVLICKKFLGQFENQYLGTLLWSQCQQTKSMQMEMGRLHPKSVGGRAGFFHRLHANQIHLV